MPRFAADLVLRNGRVWCGRDEQMAEAVAMWQGRVLATGTSAEVEDLIGSATEVIDLKGRLATPGLNDSHLHLISVGLNSAWVDARPAAAPTLDELLAAIRHRASTLTPGEWVLARGAMGVMDTGDRPGRARRECLRPLHRAGRGRRRLRGQNL